MILVCDYCKEEFERYKSKNSTTEHNFCSKKCYYSWLKENQCGRNNPNFRKALHNKSCLFCGNPFTTYLSSQKYCSKECANRAREKKVELICTHCSAKFLRTESAFLWGKKREHKNYFCSKKCHIEYQTGETNPNWIKDRTKIKNQHKTIRWSKEMEDWRNTVYNRDQWTCQMCNNESKKITRLVLNVHHIKCFSEYPDLRFDTNNGITLCEICHKKTYNKEKEFEKFFNSIINRKKMNSLLLQLQELKPKSNFVVTETTPTGDGYIVREGN